MKIIKKKNNKYEVTLDDNTKLELYDDTIIEFNLLSTKRLNDKDIVNISNYNSKIDSYYKAIKFINTKLRTRKEIEKKLGLLKYSKDSIIYTINRLEKEGYLDNKLYIKSFINDQLLLTLNGPKKIELLLNKLGFNNDDINCYLNEITNDIWNERIKKIISKKEKCNHNLSNKILINRIKKDLINLGYSNSLIDIELNNMVLDDDIDILKKEIKKEYKKLSRKYSEDVIINKLKYNMYKKGFDIQNIDNIIKEYV